MIFAVGTREEYCVAYVCNQMNLSAINIYSLFFTTLLS